MPGNQHLDFAGRSRLRGQAGPIGSHEFQAEGPFPPVCSEGLRGARDGVDRMGGREQSSFGKPGWGRLLFLSQMGFAFPAG